MKPYYEHGGITIYHGDCREVLPSIDALEAGAVVADPPYGETSLAWDRWSDGMRFHDMRERVLCAACARTHGVGSDTPS